MYRTCIQCFNKKVRCEFCNKELNKSYLRSHVKKQHLYQHYNQDDKHTTAQLRDSFPTQLCDSSRDSSRTNINTGGDLLPARQLSRKLPQLRDSFRTHNNNDDNNNNNAEANANDDNNKCNRTLLVGPSFCGETHLLLNKLRLIRLEDPEKQIRIITRSPEQYEDV